MRVAKGLGYAAIVAALVLGMGLVGTAEYEAERARYETTE